MSYTSMFGVPEKGEIECLEEYRNAWLSAPLIWNFLSNKYMNESAMNPFGNQALDSIFQLAEDENAKIPMLQHEKDALLLTADKVILRCDHFERMKQSLLFMWAATHSPKHQDNHLQKIANDLADVPKIFIGVCFIWTSVDGDSWRVFNHEEEAHEMWDISKNEGHRFLFD